MSRGLPADIFCLCHQAPNRPHPSRMASRAARPPLQVRFIKAQRGAVWCIWPSLSVLLRRRAKAFPNCPRRRPDTDHDSVQVSRRRSDLFGDPTSGRRTSMIGKPHPLAASASIPAPKLRDYALNPDHAVGRDKARGFRSIGGVTQSDWLWLHDAILRALPHTPVRRSRPRSGLRPESWEIVVSITFPNGRSAPVVTGWVEDPPGRLRMTTAYIDTGRASG